MSASQQAKRARKKMKNDPRYKKAKGAAAALFILKSTKGKKK